jgi:hypothetical protein
MAMPASSNGTTSQPRDASGRRSSSNDHPPSGHQNSAVVIHAPSNTRCSMVPIGSPRSSLRTGRRPTVDSITMTISRRLNRSVWSTPAPPVTMSASGSTDPTISRR